MIRQTGRHVAAPAASAALAAVLALSLAPAAAVADDGEGVDAAASATAASAEATAVADRAQWIDFSAERAARDVRASVGGEAELLVSYNLVSLSDEFKYHLQYESGQNYDQGFSWGDGYHALGYYQFDNRYVLQDFLVYCYGYDAETFSMFAFATDPELDITSMDMYDWEKDELTEIGQKLEGAWHAAYAAAPQLFASLQDTFAYESYYLPVERDLAAQGVDISGRRDCVKAMCWGMSSLFGTSGCHRFLGGDVYEWNDATGSYEWVYYEGAGLTDDMSDAEFVVAAGGYVVDHVAEIYSSQPEYHAGWQNRYRNEIATCLSYIPDLVVGSWYDEYVSYVQRTGVMSGYAGGYMEGRFGPEDRITRAQAATILYRAANPASTDTEDPAHYAQTSLFPDVAGGQYYTAATNWCKQNGIITGDTYGAMAGWFRPDDPVTREQLAAMLYRYADWAGCDLSLSNGTHLSAMPDVGSVSAYAYDALAWCLDNGVLTGSVENGTSYLKPADAARRAQMAKMVTVLLRDVVG